MNIEIEHRMSFQERLVVVPNLNIKSIFLGTTDPFRVICISPKTVVHPGRSLEKRRTALCGWCANPFRQYIDKGPRTQKFCCSSCKNWAKDYRRFVGDSKNNPDLLKKLDDELRVACDAKDTLDYNDRFTSMARGAGFVFNKRFIWDKQRMGMGYNGRNRYDQILFLSKGARRMPRDLSIPDVLAHKMIHPMKRIHPAEKPVELIKDLIRFCSEPGEVVLDPFAGSMATAKAGLQTGRHTVSVEIDPAVIVTAVSR